MLTLFRFPNSVGGQLRNLSFFAVVIALFLQSGCAPGNYDEEILQALMTLDPDGVPNKGVLWMSTDSLGRGDGCYVDWVNGGLSSYTYVKVSDNGIIIGETVQAPYTYFHLRDLEEIIGKKDQGKWAGWRFGIGDGGAGNRLP